jgi:hypothetical protein
MNSLTNSLRMRKTGNRRWTELTAECASWYSFTAKFITHSSESELDLRAVAEPQLAQQSNGGVAGLRRGKESTSFRLQEVRLNGLDKGVGIVHRRYVAVDAVDAMP